MNQHATLETISAYLDGEVAKEERARLEQHFADCEQCSLDRSRLQAGMYALASLPRAEPTPDESRAIRRSVIEAAGESPAPYRRLSRTWAIVGAAAVMVLGVLGYAGTSLMRRQSDPTAALQEASTARNEAALVFDSPEQLRDAIVAHPEVRNGVTLYRVKDVGARQQQALASIEKGSANQDAAAPAAIPDSAEGQATQSKTLSLCLRDILRGQPYPVMPLLARRTTFQQKPAYLLVYAFAPSSDDENARLNRIQIWVVDQAACTPLNFQQLDPEKPTSE